MTAPLPANKLKLRRPDVKPITDFMAAVGPGQPTAYHPTMDEMAFRFCLLGCTDEQLGRSFKVNEATVKRWMDAHPTFRASVMAGREEADAKVAASLYHRANGYSHKAEKIAFDKDGNELRAEYVEHYPPDTASMIFWLKNRRHDLWKNEPTTVVNNQVVNATVSLDPAEAAQTYQKLLLGGKE